MSVGHDIAVAAGSRDMGCFILIGVLGLLLGAGIVVLILEIFP